MRVAQGDLFNELRIGVALIDDGEDVTHEMRGILPHPVRKR